MRPFKMRRGHTSTCTTKGRSVRGRDTGLGRLISTKEVVHIEDVTTGQAYAESDPLRMATVNILQARTFLVVPMLRENESGRRHRHLSPGGAAIQR